MRKPRPQEYGFENESEVRLAITKEDQRIAKIRRVGVLSFVITFIISTAGVFLGLTSMPAVEPSGGSSFVQIFLGVVSGVIGLVLGLTISIAAGELADRIWRPSTSYPLAKQYLDANWMWKQILQREYGYDA